MNARRQSTPSWEQIKAFVEGALRRDRKRFDEKLKKAVQREHELWERRRNWIVKYVDTVAVEVGRHRKELDSMSSRDS